MAAKDASSQRAAATGRGQALTGLAVAGALLLLAGSRPWAHYVVHVGQGPRVSRAAQDGAADLSSAAGLLFLAGVGGVVASRGLARRIVGLLIATIAAITAVAVVLHHTSPPDSTLRALGAVRTDASAWPYVAVVGAVIGVLSGLLVATQGQRWASMGSRYESGKQPARPQDQWGALDQGIDPTIGPAE